MTFISLKRFSFMALAASTALTVSGCIGAFEEQPPRYNYVGGAKRSPIMNPGGQGEKLAENMMNGQQGAMPQTDQQRMAQDLTEMDGIPPVYQEPETQPTPMMDVTQQPLPMTGAMPNGQMAEGPSPLYYYEQQQATIGSEDISANSAYASGAMMEPLEPLEPSPLAAAGNADDGFVEVPSNANSTNISQQEYGQIEVPVMREGEASTLGSVPQQNDALQDRFNEARDDAQQFNENYPQETYPLDAQPSENAQMQPPPMPFESFEQQPMQEQQTTVSAQKPYNTSSETPYFDVAPLQTPEVSQVPQEPMLQEPIPQVPLAQEPVMQQSYDAYDQQNLQQPMREMSLGNVDDALAQSGDIPSAQPDYPVYDPSQHTVSVAEVPVVTNVEQEINTSAGPIRLTPPAPISQQRGIIGQSRYTQMRRNYSRGNVYRH